MRNRRKKWKIEKIEKIHIQTAALIFSSVLSKIAFLVDPIISSYRTCLVRIDMFWGDDLPILI